MKDISVSQTNPEHGCSKHSPSSSTFSKNTVDHGYAKLSSSKKAKKLSIMDPKQRKLSFAKIPTIKHSEKIVIDSSNSESDEPLALFKNGKSIDFIKKVTETDESSKNNIGSVAETTRNGSLDATLSKKVDDNIEQLPPSPKKSKKETIGSEAFATQKKSSPSKMANCNSKKKDSRAKMKPFKADGKRENGLKLSKKSTKINVPSDSDSDLDVPLSQLKNSPKFKKSEKAKLITPSHLKTDHTKKKFSKSAEKLKKLSQCERSPKMKISHAKSPNMKKKVHGEKGLKQKTLFDFRAQMKNEPSFAKEGMPKIGDPKTMVVGVNRVDWKSLTDEEREKIRQQKKEEWNKIRRERKKMLNQKHDDLELQNIAPLPAPKPIEMEGGLANTAFGDIAMIVEFVYVFNKFLAPEETPSITAEQLIKALAAGGQGADVISKILLVFLRALIGEEEREINGLGIGLADMPLTVFTVSELLYHYLRLTCSKPVKEDKANDSKDGDEGDEEEADDASSVASTNHGFVDEEEMPRRIITWLEKNEFFTLSASDILKVLVFLFHKIIDSEYYSDYSENLRMETRELWRQQDAFRKKAAKERKEEQSKNAESKSPATSDSMTIDKFVKKLDSTQNSDALGTDESVKTNEADDKGKEEKAEDKETKEEKEEKKEEKKKVIDVEKGPEKSEVEEGKNLELNADDELMKDYPKEPVADLVHIVRQRRVMAAKQAALKDEEEKKEKERRKEMDELQQKMKKMQAWKDGLDKCKRSLRLEPVGLDRHFKLYWVFSNGMPGIYVEDGWMYDAGEKRTIDSWEYYDSVEAVDKLLKALATQGIRESALKACLSSQYKTITSLIKKRNPDNFELQPYDVFEESIKVLKEDMLESGSKIVKGVLGMISNQEQWESKVTEGRTLEEMIPLVLELQQSVLPKFLQGTMEEEEVVKNWRENVKAGKTLSTLHTLLGILENSVKWDKSAENVKCKICRRKGGDEYLVLCDECNRGYHPYCLRPALLDFPSGSWKCPACQPAAPDSRARSRRKEEPVDYYQTGQDEESAEEEDDEKEQLEGEEESDHESLCHVCGEDGELICCDQCPKVYHLDCHEPPIRRLPRGIWICFVCRNPKMAMRFRRAQYQIEKSSKHQGRSGKAKKKQKSPSGRTSKRGRYSNPTDDEEELSEANPEESEESGEEWVKSAKKVKNDRQGARKRKDNETEPSDDEEEPPIKRTKRGSKAKPKSTRGRNSHNQEEDSDPSPKSRSRKKTRNVGEDTEIEKKKQTRRNKRAAVKSHDKDGSDSDERVSKKRRVTRKRNVSESEEAVDAAKSERRRTRLTDDLNFGRRARNRNRGNNSEIVACENILRGMWQSEFSYFFREPVDPKKVPDYEKYVPNPIDLSQIRDKLDMLEYEDAFQFVADVKLLFENCANYNEEKSEVAGEGIKLERIFFELLEENLPGLHHTLCVDT